MRKLFFNTILLFLVLNFAKAQSPEGFNYQAVVRNADGEIISNQQVGARIRLIQGSATGTVVYEETFSVTSNAVGLVNFQIGTGSVSTGNFNNIDWGNGPYFIETGIDATGGSSFTLMGTSQLMSVPYALYAKTAQNGPQGPQGPTGADGAQGPTGPAGVNGKTILNGTSIPSNSLGTDGDFYINTATNTLFGPKTAGVWGAGTSLIGPAGADGSGGGGSGADGKSAYQIWLDQGNSGSEADFLASLKGADGTKGDTGATGPAGAKGDKGDPGNTGVTGPKGDTGAKGDKGDAGTDGKDGGGLLIYDAGNGAYVRASATGVTFAKNNGVGTLTVPAGVIVSAIRIKGETADLSSNQFDIVIDYTDEDMNTEYASLFPPTLNVINSGSETLGGPSTTFPFTYDAGSDPQRQVIGVENGNVTVRVKNLNAFSKWIIALDL